MQSFGHYTVSNRAYVPLPYMDIIKSLVSLFIMVLYTMEHYAALPHNIILVQNLVYVKMMDWDLMLPFFRQYYCLLNSLFVIL